MRAALDGKRWWHLWVEGKKDERDGKVNVLLSPPSGHLSKLFSLITVAFHPTPSHFLPLG